MNVLIALITSRLFRNLLLFCAALVSLWVTGLEAGLSKSDWASWVQAVGSIGAIYVAFWIANEQVQRQRRSEMRAAAAERLRIADFAEAIISDAIATLKATAKNVKKWPVGSGYIYHERELVSAAIATLRILLEQPLPMNVSQPVLLAHSTVLEVDAACKLIEGQGPTVYMETSNYKNFWDTMSVRIKDIESKISVALVCANSDPDLNHY